jgi:hypothetical protein
VISQDELAAVVAALQALRSSTEAPAAEPAASRWKRAGREPELELEDLRVR